MYINPYDILPSTTNCSGIKYIKNIRFKRGQREGEKAKQKTESARKPDSGFLWVEPNPTQLLVLPGIMCLLVFFNQCALDSFSLSLLILVFECMLRHEILLMNTTINMVLMTDHYVDHQW